MINLAHRDSGPKSYFDDRLSDVEAMINEIETALEKAAEAKVKAERLDEMRRIKRSSLFVFYRSAGKGVGESEHCAIADKQYLAVCEDCYNAMYEAETSKAKAEANRMRFEAWRTDAATERAKMGLR